MRHCALVAAVLVSALVSGCGKNTVMLISQDQEIAVGNQVAAEVRKEYGAPLTQGAEVDRVRALSTRLFSQAKRNVPYSASVVDNKKVVNAFAAPGGPLFFTTALVNTMTDANELAFVVGHEMAHVENQHGRQAINQAVMADAAVSLLLRDTGKLAQTGAAVVFNLFAMGYSRDNEREADADGLRFMARAGYDPQGSLSALRKLGGDEIHGPAKYLSTHPSTPERIGRLQAQIQREFHR